MRPASLPFALANGCASNPQSYGKAEGSLSPVSDTLKQHLEALEDGSDLARYKAARALGALGDAGAVLPLLVALRDSFDWVPREAAQALGEIGDVRAVAPLIAILQGKENDVLRHYAAEALGKIGDAQAISALVEALRDGDTDVRCHAAQALGKIGVAGAVLPLLEALQDSFDHVRCEAAQALGKIGDLRGISPLVEALKDRKPEVRRCASAALGRIAEAQTLPVCVLAADYLKSSQQLDTLEALRRIRFDEAEVHLNYHLPAIEVYCRRLLEADDQPPAAKAGARAVLTELQWRSEGKIHLRPTARAEGREAEELLRALQPAQVTVPPDELLRASETAPESKKHKSP